MTFKSVVDIDVNDEQFQQFYKLFQEYQGRVQDVPKAWKQAEEQMKKAAKVAKTLSSTSWSAKEFKAMKDEMKKTTEEGKKFHLYTMRSALQMHKMASDAKSIGKSFLGVGKTIAKMAGWGLGLAGAGLFGLGELGASAVSKQREARGMGLNQGQLRAWQTYFGKSYLGTGALQSVAGAQVDSSKWAGLIAATQGTGISFPEALKMSPDKLTYALAKAAAKRWNSENSTQRGLDYVLKAQGGLLGGTAEVRTLAAAQRHGELSKAWGQYQKASSSWNIGAGDVSKWRMFTQSLSAAGNEIEVVLTKNLSKLAPYLTQFVDSLTKDAKAFIESTLTPENMKRLGDGIKSVAEYLGSPAFIRKVKDGGEALSLLFSEIMAVARKLSWLIPSDSVPNKAGRTGGGLIGGGTNYPKYQHILVGENARKAWAAHMEKQYGLPPGTLWGIYGAESNYGKNIGPSKSGAFGPFQIMPQNYSALGIKQPQSFMQESRGAAKLLAQYRARYHGDQRKALAAYNAGPAKVDAAIASKGTHWMEALPAETRAYVPKVTLVIDNRAGANIYSLANAAGY